MLNTAMVWALAHTYYHGNALDLYSVECVLLIMIYSFVKFNNSTIRYFYVESSKILF